jgi:phospholipid/cholesterol/gamma-HCH transport system substrate-binding protein
VGLEFQGLTGVAAISLTGGAATAAAVPLDEDGVPVLTADLSEVQSIRESLHNVDRLLIGNRSIVKDALLSFETYTASLAGRGETIESIMRKADDVFEGVDLAVTRIDNLVPGLADGTPDDLFRQVKSIRELAESFNRKSGAVMEEGRRSLADISQAAVRLTRKLDAPMAASASPAPPRRPAQKLR